MKTRSCLGSGSALILGLSMFLPLGCSDGSDGAPGPQGPQGPAGPAAIDASTASPETLASLDVVSEVTGISIASPPVVTFTVKTAQGVPIVGLASLWEASNSFIRFTLTKLVPGENGDPDTWVAYTRSATSGAPSTDNGASVVDNDDGSYTFTFATDVTALATVSYEPTLTHRLAGQIGSNSVALPAQNLVMDFVPDGSAVTRERKIATMSSCNECHDNLVFHGRRFEVEYCVQCHNPDLAEGEGDLSFMIHRIHDAGTFAVLDDGRSYAEVTYPQEVVNCRKCHNVEDAATPQADNWRTLPNMSACDGCHDIFNPNAAGVHPVTLPTNNTECAECHTPADIERYHLTSDPTPNNPEVPAGRHIIEYEILSAAVGMGNEVTIQFKILSDGTPLDILNLPAEFKNMGGTVLSYPGFLLAWAAAQDGVATPADWNNLKVPPRDNAQPPTVSLGTLGPSGSNGTLTFDGGTGVMTATITNANSQFPVGSTLRAVGLQGYLNQDIDGTIVSLHAPSVVKAVTGDAVRRSVVDATKCANCHDWFNGHGGNRVFAPGSDLICAMCHNPNMSSTGRRINPATVTTELPAEAIAIIGTNPLVYPEDAQNFKDMVHGIHSSGFRTRAYEHVRGPTREGYYDWSEVTFPTNAETNNCTLCHDDMPELPLPANLLPTTVRTTAQADGQDPDLAAVQGAFANVPNDQDWVNLPTASACFYCHTSQDAWAHMWQNGGLGSIPPTVGPWTNRDMIAGSYETCAVCHGPGRIADLVIVHSK